MLIFHNRDTVSSVGYLIPRTLPFTSNDTIKTFRHAVAIDEHRKRFGVELWETQKEVGVAEGSSRKNDVHAPVMEVWFAGCHCGKLFFSTTSSYSHFVGM
jgi:uncharacterized protein (DUF2235 family)